MEDSLGRTFPNFSGLKNENFTLVPVGIFCFLFLILRNPSMDIREIVRIYVALVVFTKHVLGCNHSL